jgi:hypothetical protein
MSQQLSFSDFRDKKKYERMSVRCPISIKNSLQNYCQKNETTVSAVLCDLATSLLLSQSQNGGTVSDKALDSLVRAEAEYRTAAQDGHISAVEKIRIMRPITMFQVRLMRPMKVRTA